MPKDTSLKKILLIGSGPIVIGQGCEFDYSGVQACKALKEEGYTVILVNSNPATIMTDPEFADRTYIEPVTGQARFYYDDVDAIKKYNFITRNKLDWTDFGEQAGPMRKKEFEDICSIRKKAQLTFANETIKQRTELQERLMRKINANAWQKKSHPIHTRPMRFYTS